MVKKFVLVVLLVCSLLVIAFDVRSSVLVAESSLIIRVPDDYQTIQEAVDAANPRDIILVAPGAYYEHVRVNKTISLVGESRETTIIDGNGDGTGYIYVTADNVKISGFTIQNGGGIFLNHSSGSIIYGSTLASNLGSSAVSLARSSGNIISNNEILNNGDGVPGLIWGDGIGLEYSNSNLIIDNFISSNIVAGITLSSSHGNIVANNTITRNGGAALDLVSSSENIVIDNIVTSNGGGMGTTYSTKNTFRRNIIFKNEGGGIGVWESRMNVFKENNVTENVIGIGISHRSPNNTFVGNIISKNLNGIKIHYSNGSIIHHNNFINNTENAPEDVYPNVNIWDDGYPSGGNYWSDYPSADWYSGPYQNLTGSDGIGDTPHTLDARNKDMFPLMGPISFFDVGTWNETSCEVHVISNSSISNFQFNETRRIVSFNVTGPDFTLGFCRVTIPNIIVQDLWQNNYTILIDGKQPLTIRNWTEGTYTYIYFTYLHSEHEVIIMPEFSTWASMILMLIVLAVAIAMYKRRLLKTPIH